MRLIIVFVFIAGFLYYIFQKRKKRVHADKIHLTIKEKGQPPADEISNGYKPAIVGVTHNNTDGTNRQKIISKCKAGEQLDLIRDPKNPHDPSAIGVFRKPGEQLGWLPGDLTEGTRQYAYHIDRGGEVKAKVFKVIGGLAGKNYGCLIDIEKGEIPYLEKEVKARDAIQKAKSLEDSNPEQAVLLYKIAIQILGAADKIFKKTIHYEMTGKILRTATYPINRLTLLLEKSQRYEECLEVIEGYDQMIDKRGLSKSDRESINKRKARIIKKLSS